MPNKDEKKNFLKKRKEISVKKVGKIEHPIATTSMNGELIHPL